LQLTIFFVISFENPFFESAILFNNLLRNIFENAIFVNNLLRNIFGNAIFSTIC